MLRIYIHELCSLEAVFLIKRYSTVKDCFARNTALTDSRMVSRIVGWIQRMTLYTRNRDQVNICLESGCHCPHHIIDIKDIDIFIHQNYMFQLCKC